MTVVLRPAACSHGQGGARTPSTIVLRGPYSRPIAHAVGRVYLLDTPSISGRMRTRGVDHRVRDWM